MILLRRSAAALNRLLDALADRRRAGWTMAALLVAYCVVWTLYGVIAKGSQDIHFDMGEMVAWSREVTWGTVKHPPFGAWLTGAWFSVFPLTDASYYLFAMVLAGVSLWFAWMTAAPYLAGDRRAAGLALLSLVPFFNFHALKYNANTVMMPLWGLATWTFLRSFESRKPGWAIAAGVAAAAAMLGKYWSLILLVGLGVAALADHRRAAYFRSSAPWLTIAAGALALASHFVWLYGNDFAPFGYAVTTHPASLLAAARSGLDYVAGAAAYGAPVLVGFALLRPSWAAIRDTAWPAAPERRLVLLAFVLPLVMPAVAAVASHSAAVSLWSIGSMTLLPVVALSSPHLALPRPAARRILAVAFVVPLVALLASPIVATVVHREGVPNRATHYRQLAAEVERLWDATTDRPLRIVSSYVNLLYGTVFYFADRPTTYEIGTPALSPWIDAARLAREGVAYYCPVDDDLCLRAMDKHLARTPPARREEVVISRTYRGVADAPDRFVIAIVPPAK
jgi:4-amino-4-deoxy-L-arabinose transferase-like glycosyltransferase